MLRAYTWVPNRTTALLADYFCVRLRRPFPTQRSEDAVTFALLRHDRHRDWPCVSARQCPRTGSLRLQQQDRGGSREIPWHACRDSDREEANRRRGSDERPIAHPLVRETGFPPTSPLIG